MLGGALSLGTASQGGKVAWIVPTYKNGRSLWRWAESTVADLKKAGKAQVNRTERMIEFQNGGFLGVYSSDNEDSIRGESFHLVILDEAARIPETAWQEAIQPTLADFNGDAILISTPKGRNWFWIEFQRGLEGGEEQKSYSAPSSDNPNPNIQKAARLARERIPDASYRQEWLAQFLEDGGGVFRNVQACATATRTDRAQPGRQYVAGVDVASLEDFTVVSVIDVEAREMVYMDRFNRCDYPALEDRLHALYERYKLDAMMVEANSIGRPVIDHLVQRGMAVQPFTTTNLTKAAIIQGLQSSFEHNNIRILNDPILINELLAFEAVKTKTGNMSYSAPEGYHDDCVMSLAIANHAISNRVTLVDNPLLGW